MIESASATLRVRASVVTRTMLVEAVSGAPTASGGQVAERTERVGVDWSRCPSWSCAALTAVPAVSAHVLRVGRRGRAAYGADRTLQAQVPGLWRFLLEFPAARWLRHHGAVVQCHRRIGAVRQGLGNRGRRRDCGLQLSDMPPEASRNAPLSAVLTLGWVVMSQGLWTQVSASLADDAVLDHGCLGGVRQHRAGETAGCGGR